MLDRKFVRILIDNPVNLGIGDNLKDIELESLLILVDQDGDLQKDNPKSINRHK